jgi:tetratricopeptide (TPR) repeat protein
MRQFSYAKHWHRAAIIGGAAIVLSGCSMIDTFQVESHEVAWKKDRDQAYAAMDAKDYARSESFYLKALKEAKAHDPQHQRELTTCMELGDVYLAEGKLEDAERQYQQAVLASKDDKMPNTTRAEAMNSWAKVLDQESKFDEAKQRYGEAHEYCRAYLNERGASVRRRIRGNYLAFEKKYIELRKSKGQPAAEDEKIRDSLSVEDAVNDVQTN